MNIPNWFLVKNLSEHQRCAYSVGNSKIEKETEKAVLIKVESDFGKFTFWCPKSILGTQEKFTLININGRRFSKEILAERPKMLAELGLTREQVLAMDGIVY